jgi:predicted helicase
LLQKNKSKYDLLINEAPFLRGNRWAGLMALSKLEDTPQKQGFEFEKFLKNMFSIFGLNPRESFRITGEQIDGSIGLDNEIYLIEAKWHNSKVSVNELDAFSAKIKRKAEWTRGLFISFSGFTQEAVNAFEKGNVNLITMTGEDIYFILKGDDNKYVDLLECLRHKCRYTAETGNIIYPALNIIKANGK